MSKLIPLKDIEQAVDDGVIILVIKRLQTAMKYGDDMRSSRAVCIEDAIRILEMALENARKDQS